jgi:hypothetical protein
MSNNIQRRLPPPSASFSQLTPPMTSEMSSSSSYDYRTSQIAADMRYPVQSQGRGPVSQTTPSYPYYSKQPAPTIRSPPAIQALVMPDPPERRKSPSSNSTSVSPALQLPNTIHAPQLSLPQLAAEVRNHLLTTEGASSRILIISDLKLGYSKISRSSGEYQAR